LTLRTGALYNVGMAIPLLATKLYFPAPRPNAVRRERLLSRLEEGEESGPRKLILVSAPAGYGKTTLLGDWLSGRRGSVAWLSLDEADNDPARFLAYLVAALRTVEERIGESALGMLQNAYPVPSEEVLTLIINDINNNAGRRLFLVLDDYHAISSESVNAAVAFLLRRLPDNLSVIVATREEPKLPVARLRAKGELTELRTGDLRFTASEAEAYLAAATNLRLSPDDVATLEARTEGWIAGLQLAALSLRGEGDPSSFLREFAGGHRHVLDYLLEEVLERQSPELQRFLLRTSILERMCGSLCEAMIDSGEEQETGAGNGIGIGFGQETLRELERANLFLVPLDNERRWYRYHHLFAELLRKRLADDGFAAELHVRASSWFEERGFPLEAFRHAIEARDAERAERLLEGGGMPLLFRGAAAPILQGLQSLPPSVLSAKPSLWVTYASALLMVGRTRLVAEKLANAEAALADAPDDEETRDLLGHVASIRASLAVSRHERDVVLEQSKRALALLRPGNLPVRAASTWSLGYAYDLAGERAEAGKAYAEAQAASLAIGHTIMSIMTTLGLASLAERDARLDEAAEAFRHVLELAGDPPFPVACEAYLGLARIALERNELGEARHFGETSARLARGLENTDRYVASELLLAELQLAEGEGAGASARLAKLARLAEDRGYADRLPEIESARLRALLSRGLSEEAGRLAGTIGTPLARARTSLALRNPAEAIAIAEPELRRAESRGWTDERLQALVVVALARRELEETERAVRFVGEALALAEPGGFVRTFVGEGEPMARLLAEAVAANVAASGYAGRLLTAFGPRDGGAENVSAADAPVLLIEPLTLRETEVLKLISEGFSNREIGEKLYLAVSSVKGHNQNIFGKLQAKSRTEAVARARDLGLL